MVKYQVSQLTLDHRMRTPINIRLCRNQKLPSHLSIVRVMEHGRIGDATMLLRPVAASIHMTHDKCFVFAYVYK